MLFAKHIFLLVLLLVTCAACDSANETSIDPPVLIDADEYEVQRESVFEDSGFYIVSSPITFTFTNTTGTAAFIPFCPSTPSFSHPEYQKQVGGEWMRPFMLDTVTYECTNYETVLPNGIFNGEHLLVVPEANLEVDDIEGTYRLSIVVYSEPWTESDGWNVEKLLHPDQRVSNEFRLLVKE